MSAMRAEGIWYNSAQAPRLMRFCPDEVVFLSRGVSLEDMADMALHIPLEDMRATPHGYQKSLLVEDDELPKRSCCFPFDFRLLGARSIWQYVACIFRSTK
jgi:hypothetical protein